MRPLESRFNPSRSNNRRNVMSKFIIVSEGYRTEPRYFTALSDNRRIAGINSLIDIIILQRESSDAGCSCPKTILDLLDEYMSSVRCGHHSLDLIINSIANSSSLSSEETERYRDSVTSFVRQYCDSEGFIKDENKTMNACTMLFKEMFSRDPVLDLPKLIDYRDDVDHICIVVDVTKTAEPHRILMNSSDVVSNPDTSRTSPTPVLNYGC